MSIITDMYDEAEGRYKSTSPISKRTDIEDPYGEKYPTNDKFENYSTNMKPVKAEPKVLSTRNAKKELDSSPVRHSRNNNIDASFNLSSEHDKLESFEKI